ncbi:MAG TPA: zinc-dependent metalloprotease [Actinomycetales bacterium]|nr:zinc-dependent metalloprotease [Actinomycetales bacterium]
MTTTPLDWKLAQDTAARLARPGPKASLVERRELVADLRMAAAAAPEIVAQTALLKPAQQAQVRVVDRANWSRSVISGLSAMIGSAIPTTTPATAQAAGLEVGVLIAFLASRVLGQYDPWAGDKAGRLTLVAPNILASERALDVDPSAFRMWVCLHEQTHVSQFDTAPWLGKYVSNTAQELTASLMNRERVSERVVTLLRGLVETVRDPKAPSLLEITASDAELEMLDRLTAVMSLLEGHADVIMDAVGEDIVPGVGKIRKVFDARRSGQSRDRKTTWDQIIRRLLGLDTKIAQYREGAKFVRAVEATVGRAGLNRVWESEQNLPTITELRAPHLWTERVHG